MAYGIVIILAFVAVIGFFLYLASNSEEETMYGEISRYVFTMVIFLAILLSLNLVHVMAVEDGMSSSITTTLRTSYVIGVWIFFLTAAYLTISLGLSIYNQNRLIKEADEDDF